MRWTIVLLLGAAACQDGGGGGGAGAARGQPPANEERTASAPTAAASAPPPTLPDPTPAPTTTSEEFTLVGSKVTLALRGGGKITLPAIAKEGELKSTALLPAEVKQSKLYHLGGDKRLLLVSELERATKSCQELIDGELEKVKKAQADTDPTRKAIRSIARFETFEAGGGRALYVEAKQRGLGREEQRPFAGTASLTMCAAKDALFVLFASDQAELPAGIAAMMRAIATSYAGG
jgi:hypothetical protein